MSFDLSPTHLSLSDLLRETPGSWAFRLPLEAGGEKVVYVPKSQSEWFGGTLSVTPKIRAIIRKNEGVAL